MFARRVATRVSSRAAAIPKRPAALWQNRSPSVNVAKRGFGATPQVDAYESSLNKLNLPGFKFGAKQQAAPFKPRTVREERAEQSKGSNWLMMAGAAGLAALAAAYFMNQNKAEAQAMGLFGITLGGAAEPDLVPGGKVGPDIESMPVLPCPLATAPNVPPPIERNFPAVLKMDMTCDVVVAPLTNKLKYTFWTFNGTCPGPFIRARQGDVLDLTILNNDMTGMGHNVDFHAVTGPGGGAAVTFVESGASKRALFRLIEPGLFVYHCAAAPVPMHVANGMYGLIFVEPEGGMPKVDKEFYVMQSEFYYDEPDRADVDPAVGAVAEFSYAKGLMEQADSVVFNGREGSLTQNKMLQAKTGDRVRIFFGNGGPNLTSSFHVIGATFDKVYNMGDVVSPPARKVQTVTVPPGGATVVDIPLYVPGNFTLVDHAVFRFDKGAIGFLSVTGPKAPGVFEHGEPAAPCPGCKLHP